MVDSKPTNLPTLSTRVLFSVAMLEVVLRLPPNTQPEHRVSARTVADRDRPAHRCGRNNMAHYLPANCNITYMVSNSQRDSSEVICFTFILYKRKGTGSGLKHD